MTFDEFRADVKDTIAELLTVLPKNDPRTTLFFDGGTGRGAIVIPQFAEADNGLDKARIMRAAASMAISEHQARLLAVTWPVWYVSSSKDEAMAEAMGASGQLRKPSERPDRKEGVFLAVASALRVETWVGEMRRGRQSPWLEAWDGPGSAQEGRLVSTLRKELADSTCIDDGEAS